MIISSRAQFQPALEAIRAANASASDILAAMDFTSSLDWLSVILLLDQIPRNCYRGQDSAMVFTNFDPLAQEIALQAIAAGVPAQSPQIRWRLAYRLWFFLPLMHSEDLAVHELATKEHVKLATEMEEFTAPNRDTSSMDELTKRCYTILSGRRNEMRDFLKNTSDYELRHKVIIERFGRYPHRNQALSRKPSPEETEYLENGGETFS